MASRRDEDAPLGPPARGAPRKEVLLRLSPELHAELRRWATAEMRSLNAHMEYLLRQAVLRRRGQHDDT